MGLCPINWMQLASQGSPRAKFHHKLSVTPSYAIRKNQSKKVCQQENTPHPQGRWIHPQAGVASSEQVPPKLGVPPGGCHLLHPYTDPTPQKAEAPQGQRPHPNAGCTLEAASFLGGSTPKARSVAPKQVPNPGATVTLKRVLLVEVPPSPSPIPKNNPQPRIVPFPAPVHPARPGPPLPAAHARSEPCRSDPSRVVLYRAGPAHCGPPPGGEDGREAAEARREGEDRPLRAGGYAGGRHLRQSQGLSTEG